MIIGSREFLFDGREPRAYAMGILNFTPDSFSDGGKFLDHEKALARALQMESEGADLIDIGAESTRPGSSPVSEEEEKRRLIPVLKKIVPELKIPISIDTQKASVAAAALEEGAAMINDVSALGDEEMAAVVSRHRVPIVLMHRKGVPATMQEHPVYEDVVRDVLSFLERKIRRAVDLGVDREKILIDPGFGFGKRFEDNLTLIKSLEALSVLKAPVVVGVSRKSFLKKIFGPEDGNLLIGGAAAATLAVKSRVSVIRTHDVAPIKAAIRLALSVEFS